MSSQNKTHKTPWEEAAALGVLGGVCLIIAYCLLAHLVGFQTTWLDHLANIANTATIRAGELLKQPSAYPVITVALIAYYIWIASVARMKDFPTDRLLAFFKSFGFTLALWLIALKLPQILETTFPRAAPFAEVYRTLSWILFALLIAIGKELWHETSKIRCTKA